MKLLITSSLIIGAVFLLGASTSSNAIDTQSLVKSSHDSNIIKIKGGHHSGGHGNGHHGGGHGHHGHHGGWNGGWGGGWGGGFGGPDYYYGGPSYYAVPGPGICIGPLCVL